MVFAVIAPAAIIALRPTALATRPTAGVRGSVPLMAADSRVDDWRPRKRDSYFPSPDTETWLAWQSEQDAFHEARDAEAAEAVAAATPPQTEYAPVAARPSAPRPKPETLEEKLAVVFSPSPADSCESHLEARDGLVGSVGSAELLKRDEECELWPQELETDPKARSMLWVDELSCIGCKYCADIARSTFAIAEGDSDYGTARVVQQSGDTAETVDEAIASCPADCIHKCSRVELEILEEYRELYMNDLMARSHTQRLVGQGEGGGSLASPHWRDPLVNTGWRKGRKYVKTERLRLSDPLI